jgi:transcriptional regulator with XRE-family HTH domain
MAPTPAQKFGKWLESELKAKGMGKRTLARRMLPKDTPHNQLENQRIAIISYAKGETNPTRETRKRIARALKVKLSDMPPEVDDEEADVLIGCYEKVSMKTVADLREGGERRLRQARLIEKKLAAGEVPTA